MASRDTWRCKSFRQATIAKIEKSIPQHGIFRPTNILDWENRIFLGAKSKEEYLKCVARAIAIICEKNNVKKPKMPDPTISHALKGILEEGFMSDFSFRVQDKTFPVHKTILSARSSVFRAMFTVDMKEKESSSVDIPDMDADTFQRMLNFIYSDSVEDGMQWNNVSKLFYAADKFALELLKQKCSQLLKIGLCVSSVLDVLVLADKHHDEDLKAAALSFIEINEEEIIPTEHWQSFAEKNLKLAFDTLQMLYVKKMG